MMSWIFCGMIGLAVVFGALGGRMEMVSTAAMEGCGEAITLVLTLAGSMSMWSGVMRVADRAGLTQRLSRLFEPVTRMAFQGIDSTSAAGKAIAANMAANLLGLGNAATPLGIAAMQELDKAAGHPGIATNNMIVFVVVNTAAIEVLPTTVALLRLKAGAAAPMDILPAVLVASTVSVVLGVMTCKLLSAFSPSPERLPPKAGRAGKAGKGGRAWVR